MFQDQEIKPTPLYELHKGHSARFVNFSGYALPLHFGSVIDEHRSVRSSAGLFDLSHLCAIEVSGAQAHGWLRSMLTNDVEKLSIGQGMYTCLCYHHGGVVDDMRIFKLDTSRYRMYIDSARQMKDMAWLQSHIKPEVELTEINNDSVIAVQGPDASLVVSQALKAMGQEPPIMTMLTGEAIEHSGWLISRTGYTGEDGFELTIPSEQAPAFWQAAAKAGAVPVGLGARDSLRVEAGYAMYGQDIDEQHSPEESGIGQTVDISDPSRVFIGREVLEEQKRFGGRFFRVGLVLGGSGLLRRGAEVERVGQSIGTVTSGSFSPGRAASVGFARVERKFIGQCDVMVKQRLRSARTVSVPFVPHGHSRL